jgi:stage II sporulation protein D (peptidoglycan lytic transglycosylase)
LSNSYRQRKCPPGSNSTIFLLLILILVSGTTYPLQAAYQNPILKVLLFDSTAGLFISNPNGLTLSRNGIVFGSAERVMVTPDDPRRLLINKKLKIDGFITVTTTGETSVLNLDSHLKRRYLGTFTIRPFKGGLHLINHIPTESYLEGVLNAEISTRWHMEVVKAQAVVSRTFALFKRQKQSQHPWHLSSGHYDQVYKGTDIADERGKSAILATSGIVVGFRGKLAQTFYHSNCGGMTADPGNVWQYRLPYLKIRKVPFGNKDPRYHWQATIKNQELVSILKRAGVPINHVGTFAISKRTRSNRVHELTITGSTNRTLSGNGFRKAAGYKRIQSLLFDINRIPGGFQFRGTGNGHGVGLSQWSAKEMAEEGYKYHEILYYFYEGIELMRHQE